MGQKTQHTPGPWSYRMGHIGDAGIEGPYGEDIGFVNISDGFDEPNFYPTEANARLIAAAPDLLAALEEVTAIYRDDLATEDEPACIRRALAAIARARST